LEHGELYRSGQERIDLLNSVASSFFLFLNNLFYEDAILHLCRLTDPPQMGVKDNLTVMRLPELDLDPPLKAAVQVNAGAVEKSCAFARTWRNKSLAHTDLGVRRGGLVTSLPAVNPTDIEEGMKSIQNMLRSVEEYYGRPHSISISNPWGSKSLVAYLEHSKKLRDREEASWGKPKDQNTETGRAYKRLQADPSQTERLGHPRSINL
jgi:AbiU2